MMQVESEKKNNAGLERDGSTLPVEEAGRVLWTRQVLCNGLEASGKLVNRSEATCRAELGRSRAHIPDADSTGVRWASSLPPMSVWTQPLKINDEKMK